MDYMQLFNVFFAFTPLLLTEVWLLALAIYSSGKATEPFLSGNTIDIEC